MESSRDQNGEAGEDSCGKGFEVRVIESGS
jgi:hypothetical protein